MPAAARADIALNFVELPSIYPAESGTYADPMPACDPRHSIAFPMPVVSIRMTVCCLHDVAAIKMTFPAIPLSMATCASGLSEVHCRAIFCLRVDSLAASPKSPEPRRLGRGPVKPQTTKPVQASKCCRRSCYHRAQNLTEDCGSCCIKILSGVGHQLSDSTCWRSFVLAPQARLMGHFAAARPVSGHGRFHADND